MFCEQPPQLWLEQADALLQSPLFLQLPPKQIPPSHTELVPQSAFCEQLPQLWFEQIRPLLHSPAELLQLPL
jgi:hypothetical protein